MRLLVILLLLLTAIAASSTAQDALTCEDGLKPITHALGEVCVPETPQRVVALDMAVIELLLIAENPPVAGSSIVFDSFTATTPAIKPALDAILENGVDVGFPPNMEALLTANPDLIIAPRDLITETLYPRWSGVTAVVLFEPMPGDWRFRMRYAGEVLGLSDLAETLIADFDARVAEFREVMPETEVPLEISLVRTWPGQIGLSVAGAASSALLEEVGLARPESQRLSYEYVMTELNGWAELRITEEEMLMADGDLIFIFGDPSVVADNVLWKALPAVAAGRVHEVGYHWYGDSLINAHLMLDDLFAYVAQVEPELPNPFINGIPPYEVVPETTATPEE